MAKCKLGFHKSKGKCIKDSGDLIRVHYETPTNFGYEKSDIKLFKDKKKADSYAKKLVKELKERAKETDDDEMVIVENLNSGEFIDRWVNQQGVVENY
jgi:hypothetical protein